MSKKRKAKRRTRQKRPYTGQNHHHLLFQGRHWNQDMAKTLRNSFIYLLDVKVHDELHNAVLHDIPKPSPEALKLLYLAFLEQRQEISQMDIVKAAEWLSEACKEEPYHSCMAHQAQFLKEKLKKS